MKYWDSSAFISLLLEEPRSPHIRSLMKEDPWAITWWGTPLECLSALWRRKREVQLPQEEMALLLTRLEKLTSEIDFVEPTSVLRERAGRLLALHPLRTGDALQLAAALLWAEEGTKGVDIISLDGRLREASLAEGFTVLPLTL